MEIRYTAGDMLAGGHDAIVNPVNTVGVMGKGLALVVKQRYPHAFAGYREAWRNGTLRVGRPVATPPRTAGQPWVVHVPTKRNWREGSRQGDVEQGIEGLRLVVEAHQWETIGIPPLGCGLGGLAWPPVARALERVLRPSPSATVAVVYGQAPDG